MDRVVEAVRWRVEALYQRLPREQQVWLDNCRLPAKVRRGHAMFDRERLTSAYRQAWTFLLRSQPTASLGDYLEFGVYYGTSMSCMSDAVRDLGLEHVRLFGFDSFEGLPASAAFEDDGEWVPGQFKASVELAREYLERNDVPDERVTLVKGWFSDTLTPEMRAAQAIEHASVIMVDCDLYSSATEALAFCEPLIRQQAIIFFDDWNAGGLGERNLGERRAFEEFLERHPDIRAERLRGLDYKDKKDVRVFRVTRG